MQGTVETGGIPGEGVAEYPTSRHDLGESMDDIHVSDDTQVSDDIRKYKCYRISGVPCDWDRENVLSSLQSISDSDVDLLEPDIRLYPSTTREAQIVLMTIRIRNADPFFTNGNTSLAFNFRGYELEVDCHFYGMTPLNRPKDVIADAILVTGLAGHAYGSWRDGPGKMWPEDFLPIDVPNIRIMTYGYNSSLIEATPNRTWRDYTSEFLQYVSNTRSSYPEENLPIIFIGHSMGGLLIERALLEARNGSTYEHIFHATRGLVCFGTPHGGMKVDDINAMLEGREHILLQQLSRRSEFLFDHREDLAAIWRLPALSFYERKPTPSVKKTGDIWHRDGNPAEMVYKDDAVRFAPLETRIGVDADHRGIAKVRTREDHHYCSLITHVKKWLTPDGLAIGLDIAVDNPAYFVGREDALRSLHRDFRVGSKVVQVLHGLGGVGKTSLARQFVRELRLDGWTVLWFSSKSEKNIVDEFKNATAVIGRIDSHAQLSSNADTVQWMDSKFPNRWIMVLDECDDSKINFAKFIPSQSGGKFLITSRIAGIPRRISGASEVEIVPLDEQSAIKLLSNSSDGYHLTSRPTDTSHVAKELDAQKQIVSQVGYLPLAITIIASFISDNDGWDFQRYIRAQSSFKREAVLGQPLDFSDYQESVWGAFEMSLARLQLSSPLIYFIAACGDMKNVVTLRNLYGLWSEKISNLDRDIINREYAFLSDDDRLSEALQRLRARNLLQQHGLRTQKAELRVQSLGMHTLIVDWLHFKHSSECAKAARIILMILSWTAAYHLEVDEVPEMNGFKALIEQTQQLATRYIQPLDDARIPFPSGCVFPWVYLSLIELFQVSARSEPGVGQRMAHAAFCTEIDGVVKEHLSAVGDNWETAIQELVDSLPEQLKNAVESDSKKRPDQYRLMCFIDTLDSHPCFEMAATTMMSHSGEWYSMVQEFALTLDRWCGIRHQIKGKVLHQVQLGLTEFASRLREIKVEIEHTRQTGSPERLQSLRRALTALQVEMEIAIPAWVTRARHASFASISSVEDNLLTFDGTETLMTAYFVALRQTITENLGDFRSDTPLPDVWDSKKDVVRDMVARILQQILGPDATTFFTNDQRHGNTEDWNTIWLAVWELMWLGRLQSEIYSWIGNAMVDGVKSLVEKAVKEGTQQAIETCLPGTDGDNLWRNVQNSINIGTPTWFSAGWHLDDFSKDGDDSEALKLLKSTKSSFIASFYPAHGPVPEFRRIDGLSLAQQLVGARRKLHQQFLDLSRDRLVGGERKIAAFLNVLCMQDADKPLIEALCLAEKFENDSARAQLARELAHTITGLAEDEKSWRWGTE